MYKKFGQLPYPQAMFWCKKNIIYSRLKWFEWISSQQILLQNDQFKEWSMELVESGHSNLNQSGSSPNPSVKFSYWVETSFSNCQLLMNPHLCFIAVLCLFVFYCDVSMFYWWALRKHAYSNTMKISPPKTESFQIKSLIVFIFLLKTQIVGTR